MAVQFTWSPTKAEANLRKHGISFEDAATAFGDPLARIFGDEFHSADEERELLVGHTNDGRLVMVSFLQRGSIVRIISARETTQRERRDYEEGAS